MKQLSLLISFCLITFFSFGQSQRLVFIEEFTQASCGPCASANPSFNALLSANTTKAVSLKYQTSWPGTDPMNAQNPTEVQNRVTYYGVSGVPNAMMDGNVVNGSPGAITQTGINNEYNVPSPFTINLKHWFNGANDSIYINCEVICTQNVTMTTPKLRIALTEKTISFGSPPGSNGETVFYDVMRKMFPNGNGSILAGTWTVGQTMNVSFYAKIPTYIYSKPQLATVAWIQDDNTKNILQSGYNATASMPLALPPAADFAADVVTSCDGIIGFKDLSALFPNAWSWNFGDGTTSTLKNPTHQYFANGTYNVQLTASNSNGNNMLTKNAYITVALSGTAPNGVNDNICGSGVANLSASGGGGALNWYNAAGTLVNTGTNYAPTITGTTNFYVAEMIPNSVLTMAAPDNTIGAGAYFTANTVHGLYFDVTKPCVLQTVNSYANTAGNRTIIVQDNNGVTVNSAVVNMAVGLNTVTLNFQLAAGTGYLIKIGSGLVDLFRNSAGAIFPYTSSVVTITGNTAAANPTYYYFFYDWKVQQNPCATPAKIISGIDSCAAVGIANITLENSLNVFPNPNDGAFTVNFNSQESDNYQVTITNTLGQIVYQEKLDNFVGNYSRNMDVNTFGKGVYLVSISNSNHKTVKKILAY